jgi:hypothetical protein
LVVDYDVTKALPYIKKLNEEQTQQKITMTHMMSKAICIGMSKMRRDMGRIKWGYVIFKLSHITYSSNVLRILAYLFWSMSKAEEILFQSLSGKHRINPLLKSLLI